MESIEVRRIWARLGYDAGAAAREIGISRQAVRYHVRRAHEVAPLTYGKGDHEDRAAMGTGMRVVLKRAGIAPPTG